VPRLAALAALFVLVFALWLEPALARERTPLDVRVFARVGDPGEPEPIAIGPAHRRIFVGTNQQGKGDASAPSRIFKYTPRGKLVDDYVIKGQPLDSDHGIQGLAFDGDGLLYALDRSDKPRVITIDRKSGEQRTYARFRDVPSCSASGRHHNCSDTTGDNPAGPDYAAFAPDGRLYVTDIDQALIWRIPAGAGKGPVGRPRVWFTDPALENVFGPNGCQFMPDGRTLLFAVTAQGPSAGDPTQGALFKLRVRSDGAAGKLRRFWTSQPVDGPDGFALARSGRVYLALAGANQMVVISPGGDEIARVPATPADNLQMEVPFDGPASVAFLGERVLVTNQSTAGIPASWAVLDVFAGERGLPLFRP
jgi:sugar lactone lactonase YvrE